MKIGELAELTGLAPSKIRFYESIGLLKAVKRQSNGYRSYPPEAAVILSMIVRAQDAGFSLEELSALLPADLTQWDHTSIVTAIRQKIHDVEALRARLDSNLVQLREVLHEIEAKPADVDCADNAKRLLTEYGLVTKED
ncbi:MerR family transcriptional regulator [Oleiphilus messinensis]|uniref:MerR family transcriptional regulator n=1 Tax=Oleiphilus messinensis TaxID=141451 RepID=A0A1Y0I8E4_9GAMM|nr:MerR family transcriptional regulator [Oleiphilus messinensis]ARU56469.1 MerR family transcriptional regulator [Oleiphilus messinensis]